MGGLGHKLKPKEHLPMCCFLKEDLLVLVDLKLVAAANLGLLLASCFGNPYWASILANWCTQKMLTTQGESNLNRHDGKQVHTLVKSIYL